MAPELRRLGQEDGAKFKPAWAAWYVRGLLKPMVQDSVSVPERG